MQEMKQIKDVFKDCYGIDTILNTRIDTINLYKKTGKLEIKLVAEDKIDIAEISIFEVYLKEKLNAKEVNICVSYEKSVQYDVSGEWNKIVHYLGQKYPSIKAVLSSSDFQIKDKEIEILLNIKGRDLLKAVKLEKVLSQVLKDIYGETYGIKYTENEVEKNTYETYQKQAEEEAIKAVMKDIEKTIDSSVTSEQEDGIEDSNTETSKLIYGRTVNIKQEITNIIDISVDTDKVCIEGEVISVDSREIKNDKVIVMFNVFDGTSTITCKAFIENKKAKSVLDKVKNSKGIKVSGTAKYDQYSREIGIMANNIIETMR